MKIAVIADDKLKEELIQTGEPACELTWHKEIPVVSDNDACIDLLFENTKERKEQLHKISPAIILVNAVEDTLDLLPPGFVRINGWNSLLKSHLTEACSPDDNKAKAEKIFSLFGKQVEWVPDVCGFITPRVISMIINEAYHVLDEKVSSKEEIDIAMKLGTNYPFGPFEWSKLIGIKKIYSLLNLLSKSNSRYTPSHLLEKEAAVS